MSHLCTGQSTVKKSLTVLKRRIFLLKKNAKILRVPPNVRTSQERNAILVFTPTTYNNINSHDEVEDEKASFLHIFQFYCLLLIQSQQLRKQLEIHFLKCHVQD
jgi:hypothetical protein